MERRVRSAYVDIVERRALEGNFYRVTIAANERVRQPPELDFGGLSTEGYLRNPVVMWAHDISGRSESGGLPIGRTRELTRDGAGRLVADFEFLSEDAFAQRVKNAWDKGFLRAASISWDACRGRAVGGRTVEGHEVGPAGVVDRGGAGGPGRAAGVAVADDQGAGCRGERECEP